MDTIMDSFQSATCNSSFDVPSFMPFLRHNFIMWVFCISILITIPFLGLLLYVACLYVSCLYILFQKYLHNIKTPYMDGAFDDARDGFASIWHTVGQIWHGYEVDGLENIPDKGAAVIVFYHGPIPIDLIYCKTEIFRKTKRLVRMVIDRFMYKVPGWKVGLCVTASFPGTYEKCLQVLKDGHIIAVAPGGVAEAQFADDSYNLLWGKRRGFARLAVETKVPIIPVFTQNIREAFNVLGFFTSWLRPFYDKTKLPIIPTYGGLPVKLKTYIGDPIPYDPDITVEQLAQKTIRAVEDLIAKHQRIPGSTMRALLDRISTENLKQKSI